MRLPLIFTAFLLLFIAENSFCQRLDPFTSESGKVAFKGKMERVPYEHTAGYYDFLPPEQDPDTVIDGMPFHFLYFRIPVEVTEIGVRMISPVPDNTFGGVGDFVTPSYESNKKSKVFFDPWITIEQWQVPPPHS